MNHPDPATLLRSARRRAGLTQRELARRAATAQSVVARIEAGQTSPSAATLTRLLSAAGFEARVELSPLPAEQSHMLDDVARILRLTPEDRLRELGNADRFFSAARRV
ncbi:MAG TPA: helix-turn-helix transcriptional regulator [Gemmatimonadales bacterium]|nr:helix-turn-helix transcriptional regulator [Gemmatimonadales bacterium]